jgi:hypothetical protein
MYTHITYTHRDEPRTINGYLRVRGVLGSPPSINTRSGKAASSKQQQQQQQQEQQQQQQ